MSEESGWMPQPQPAAPAPQQGIPPGFDRLRGLVGPAMGMAGMGRMGQMGQTSAPPPTPQWSAASYAPSQMMNRPAPPPQQQWGGGRQMPQQPGNTPGRMPQQSNPMVRALRGQ